ncbi:uncharacterized protein JCM6883_001049 [Sporobolomyces salmoneus]|uniref:uncharacterized protein n=1 Tax=Sporobolomyces salmoneus TaxID=183962 RepID=UPI00317E4BF9
MTTSFVISLSLFGIMSAFETRGRSLLSCFFSFFAYIGLCKIFPLPELTQEDCDTITLGPYANTIPSEHLPSTLYQTESSDEKSSSKLSDGEG